jgi:hypothetical protein
MTQITKEIKTELSTTYFLKEHPKTNYVIEQSKYDNDPFWYVYRITSRSARIVRECELPPAYAGGFLRVYWSVQTCLSQITNKLFVSSPSTRHSVIETDESSNNHNYNNPDFYLFFTRLRVRNPVNWCNILSSINHIKVSIKGYNGFHPPAFAGGLLACSVKVRDVAEQWIRQVIWRG